MSQFSLPCLMGFGLSLLLTPMSRRIALRIGAIDQPGERRIHLFATPRFCGPGILIALALALLTASLLDGQVAAMLRSQSRHLVLLAIGALLITTVGAIDDVRSLRPRTKVCVELAAAVFAVQGGYRIEAGALLHLEALAFLVSVAFIVAAVNAVNLLDGLDGLAVGVCLIISATLFLIGMHRGAAEASLLFAALCGVLLGFLPYNFYPARIFLGDSGALLLGFMIGAGEISVSRPTPRIGAAIAAPLLALGLPIGELALTTARRILREVKVRQMAGAELRYRWFFIHRPALFTADRDHIHHRLLSLGFIHRGAVLLLYLVCTVVCACAATIACLPGMRTGLLIGLGIAGVVGLRKLAYPEFMPMRSGLLLPILGSRVPSRARADGDSAPFADHMELAAQGLRPREPEQRGA